MKYVHSPKDQTIHYRTLQCLYMRDKKYISDAWSAQGFDKMHDSPCRIPPGHNSSYLLVIRELFPWVIC